MKKFFSKIKYGIKRLLGFRPRAVLNSKINKKAKVGHGTQFVNSSIGKYSYVYGSVVICAEIGNFCSIAENCVIGGGKHPTDWVSTSPVFYKGKNCLKKNFSQNLFSEFDKTVIGNDVWIGSKAIIKGGVNVGDGAIIGMGSVVTHDVPPYEIWAGNPARCIRKRFPDDTVQKLLAIEWWNWDDETLLKNADAFNDPKKLIETLDEKER
ncbi:MAG: CatB-related O-acetyltransferase [Clostridia bacterium]|nr:CatB-related O-acetyltransferase [Clostridia bacterium]